MPSPQTPKVAKLEKQKMWNRVRLSISELVRKEASVRSIAGGCGFTMRVLNQGQHWEFKRDRILVEWWPSTGRYLVNKTQSGGKFFTLAELRGVLDPRVSQ